MTSFARLRSWLSSVFHRSHLEDGIDTEFSFHIESHAADLVRRGVPSDEALRCARIEFGGVETHKSDIRGSLGLRPWDELRIDLLFAFRTLRKSPGFTAIAVLSLALGIGANTVIFTLAKEVLLQTLGVPHPSDLRLLVAVVGEKGVVHHLWGDDFSKNAQGQKTVNSFPYPVYQRLRAQNHSLGDLLAFMDFDYANATVDGNAYVVTGELVSGNYYQQLGAVPALGRPLTPADDARSGAGAVATISDGFWARRFARSPNIIGKTVSLNMTPITIVGVNPPGFTGAANPQLSPDVFLPFSMQPLILPRGKNSLLTNMDVWWVRIMRRTIPGVSEESARAALDVSFLQAVRATMTIKAGEDLPHLTLTDGSHGLNHVGEDFAKPIYVLMFLAGLVLLLACANLANLMLARAAARQREMSVRLALGASRLRILRQVLTESLLLSSLGGAAGLLLAYLGRNFIPHLLSPSWQPQIVTATFDIHIFVFTTAVSLLTGILFGLGPGLQATRTHVSKVLKDSVATSTARSRGIAARAIVVFQIALSLLLVISAGLFGRTLVNLNLTGIGFQPENLLLFAVNPPPLRYPTPHDIALLHQLEDRVSTVPGVVSVAVAENPLLANSISDEDFIPDGVPALPVEQQMADVNWVGEHFFSTMGIPLLSGRSFRASDSETSPPVAIINKALAKKFFRHIDPLGHTFNKGKIQIVGIAADTKFSSLRDDPPPTYYLPYRQINEQTRYGMTINVRTKGDPIAVVPDIRRVVQSIDRDLPLEDVRTQQQQIDATLSQEHIFATLTAAFGALALTLASIGIYGIMAYTVSRRTNEIGLRMALGAQARQMLLMILRETSWLAWCGIVAGLLAAVVLTRFLSALLYGLKPNDPLTFASAAALLFAITLLAAWVPARRAANVQPMQALRHE